MQNASIVHGATFLHKVAQAKNHSWDCYDRKQKGHESSCFSLCWLLTSLLDKGVLPKAAGWVLFIIRHRYGN
jgi:hypothetical protein